LNASASAVVGVRRQIRLLKAQVHSTNKLPFKLINTKSWTLAGIVAKKHDSIVIILSPDEAPIKTELAAMAISSRGCD
jgi:hypothetical protein